MLINGSTQYQITPTIFFVLKKEFISKILKYFPRYLSLIIKYLIYCNSHVILTIIKKREEKKSKKKRKCEFFLTK